MEVKMKVKVNDDSRKTVQFKDIMAGQVFQLQGGNCFWLKIKHYESNPNCVTLNNGMSGLIDDPNQEVFLVDSSVMFHN